MAKPTMDLTAFVGKLLEEDDGDVLREGIRVLSQALTENEVAALIAAERHEHRGDRLAIAMGLAAYAGYAGLYGGVGDSEGPTGDARTRPTDTRRMSGFLLHVRLDDQAPVIVKVAFAAQVPEDFGEGPDHFLFTFLELIEELLKINRPFRVSRIRHWTVLLQNREADVLDHLKPAVSEVVPNRGHSIERLQHGVLVLR